MLNKWLNSFKKSHIQTKIFIFILLLNGIATFGTAIYSYIRLDLYRTGPQKTETNDRLTQPGRT